MRDTHRLSKKQKEEVFGYLMTMCVEAQRVGTPFADDSPIELFLSDLEVQAGMDGWIYRAAPSGGCTFVLCLMTAHEQRVFEAIVYGRLL